MVEVRWTEKALNDIDNIAEFIAKDSVKYAKIQVSRFFDATEILKLQPRSGRIVPEIGDNKIRELIIGNFRIIYRLVTNKQVDGLTVHHSRRLLKNNPSFKE